MIRKLTVFCSVSFALVACGIPPSTNPSKVTLVPPITRINPSNTTCPTDGTNYGFGTCELSPLVKPAPSTFNVQYNAPSKACNYHGELFECPANYEVPRG